MRIIYNRHIIYEGEIKEFGFRFEEGKEARIKVRMFNVIFESLTNGDSYEYKSNHFKMKVECIDNNCIITF
jgi:hypothetical protein